MGRQNRSRKRKDEMNRVKRVRNAKKELLRLKKTLGLLDEHGNEKLMDVVSDITEIKTSEQLRKEREEKEIKAEMAEYKDKGQDVEVINEKTQKVHVYNTKTLRDQYGTLPAWKKPRKTERKIRKREHSMKLKFKHAWNNRYVPI